jgi:hypothetical protein
MSNILSTDKLIAHIKRKAMIPENQVTFTTTDFLNFINEEILLGMVPSIMRLHEDYFLTSEDVALEDNVSSYQIPYRALGNKLRDVFYKDSGNNIWEMTRITIEQSPDYSGSASSSDFHAFYVRNDELVLVPELSGSVTGSLNMNYYIRPNSIVEEDRTGVIQSFSRLNQNFETSDVDSGTDTLTITSHGLSNGNVVFFSSTDTLPTNISSSTPYYVIGATTNTIQISTSFGGSAVDIASTGSGIHTIDCGSISVDRVSTISGTVLFDTSTKMDIIRAKSPFRSFKYDITPRYVDTANNIVAFSYDNVPSKLEVGDNLNIACETKIPQIPVEMHVYLAEKVAARCLEALGDAQGLQMSGQRIQEMEYSSGALIDNRVEGAPQKIVNRHGPLRSGFFRRRYKYRG